MEHARDRGLCQYHQQCPQELNRIFQMFHNVIKKGKMQHTVGKRRAAESNNSSDSNKTLQVINLSNKELTAKQVKVLGIHLQE